MKPQVLYISTACGSNMFNKIETTSIPQSFVYGMPIAANKFHNLIMKGFILNGYDVNAITGLPISNKTHKKRIWRTSKYSENGVHYKYLGFINIPILKHLVIGISIFFNILKWNKKFKDREKLIVYDASYVSVIPFIIFANMITKCKTIGIFSDIYDYMASVTTKNISNGKFKKNVRKLMKKCYNHTNGYVFLSEQMNKLINLNNKPYTIVEGIVDSNTKNINTKNKSSKFIIMYAGALREEYGLKILINGYHKFANNNSELWIYGDGDYSKKIINAAKKDSRIKFFGKVNNIEILQKEKEANVLINPRPTKLEFTQYSFPSKIMEYMNSGTPVLTTKLPTIPKEYKNYLFFIDKETEEGICNSIFEISKMGNDELVNYGKKTKMFIESNKSEKIQVKKIIEMSREIHEKNIK